MVENVAAACIIWLTQHTALPRRRGSQSGAALPGAPQCTAAVARPPSPSPQATLTASNLHASTVAPNAVPLVFAIAPHAVPSAAPVPAAVSPAPVTAPHGAPTVLVTAHLAAPLPAALAPAAALPVSKTASCPAHHIPSAASTVTSSNPLAPVTRCIVLLLHIAGLPNLPPELRALLEDEGVAKVGWGQEWGARVGGADPCQMLRDKRNPSQSFDITFLPRLPMWDGVRPACGIGKMCVALQGHPRC